MLSLSLYLTFNKLVVRLVLSKIEEVTSIVSGKISL
jgi:hypothetical protein